MARYTKEQIIKALECCSKGNTVDSCMSGCPLYDLNDIPPCADDEQAIFKYALEHLKADVVPRSEVEKAKQEVAREIFEEISRYISLNENIAKKCKEENGEQNREYFKGKLSAFLQVQGFIDIELKRQYKVVKNEA